MPRIPRLPFDLAAPASHRLVLLVAGVLFLIHLFTLHDSFQWGGDAAGYALHARNLVEGTPYAETGYIRNPKWFFAPQAYPPGFPLLLVPTVAVFGLDPTALKVTMTLLLALSLWVTGLLLRTTLPAGILIVVLVLFGLNPYVWSFKHNVESDIPFLLFAFASLVAYRKSIESRGRVFWGWTLVTTVCVLYTILTRTIGVVLLPCFLLHDLIRFRCLSRTLLALIGAGLLAFGLQQFLASDALMVSSGEYTLLLRRATSRLGRVASHIPIQGLRIGKTLYQLWENGFASVLQKAVFLISIPLVLLGFGVRCRRGFSIVEAFAVTYTLALLPWSFFHSRYLLPLLPLYFFYSVVGLGLTLRRAGRAAPVLVLLAVLAVGASYVGTYANPPPYPPYHLSSYMRTPADFAFFDYVQRRTPPDAVLVTIFPRVFALETRRAAVLPHVTDDITLLQDLRALGATYVVVGPLNRLARQSGVVYRLATWVDAHPDWFELVYTDADYRLYRICSSASL